MEVIVIAIVAILCLVVVAIYWLVHRGVDGPVEQDDRDDRMSALEKDVSLLKADVRGIKASLDKIWCDITKAILDLFEAIIERITK